MRCCWTGGSARTLPGPTGRPLGLALLAECGRGGRPELKPGQALYLHRVAGVKAPRVAVGLRRRGSGHAHGARRWPPAWACSRAAARHVAVAPPACARRAHAEALALVARAETYVYRHTKPSAPPAVEAGEGEPGLPKAAAAALDAGLARGAGHRRGRDAGARVRQPPGQPLHADAPGRRRPRRWPRARPEGRGARPQGLREARHGRLPGGGAGFDEPPKFIVMRWQGAAKSAGAGGAGGQGHHLRHRRHLAQARRPRWTR
jgi:leucyl aminopeptidase